MLGSLIFLIPCFSSLSNGEKSLTWSAIQDLLLKEGEKIAGRDLDYYLSALLGASAGKIDGDSIFNSENFAEHILGFES